MSGDVVVLPLPPVAVPFADLPLPHQNPLLLGGDLASLPPFALLLHRSGERPPAPCRLVAFDGLLPPGQVLAAAALAAGPVGPVVVGPACFEDGPEGPEGWLRAADEFATTAGVQVWIWAPWTHLLWQWRNPHASLSPAPTLADLPPLDSPVDPQSAAQECWSQRLGSPRCGAFVSSPSLSSSPHSVVWLPRPTAGLTRDRWWMSVVPSLARAVRDSGATEVCVSCRPAIGPSWELLLATAAAWAPSVPRLCLALHLSWLLPSPSLPPLPSEHSPRPPPHSPYSLRACPGLCSVCSRHDLHFAATSLHKAGAAAPLRDVVAFALALRDDPLWWLHQSPRQTPLAEESVLHPDYDPTHPLASALSALLHRSAIAPPPPPDRLPLPDEYLHEGEGARLPWVGFDRPADRVSSPVHPRDRGPLFAALLEGVAAGWVIPVPTEFALCTSLLFVVWQSGKPRVCFDPRSVNARLRAASVSYDRLDLMRGGSHLQCGFKADVKSAFKLVRMAREDWPYLCVVVAGHTFALTRLWFGISHGPRLFCRSAALVLDPHRPSILPLPPLMAFVDDIGRSSPHPVWSLVAATSLFLIITDGGLWPSVAKWAWSPASVLKILGLVIHFPTGSLRVAESAAAKALAQADHLASAVVPGVLLSSTLAAVAASFLGRISAFGEALPAMRPFRVAMNAWLRLSPVSSAEACAELEFLRAWLPHAHLHSHDSAPRFPILFVVFDASSPRSGAAAWSLASIDGSSALRMELLPLAEHFDPDRLTSSAAFEAATLVALLRTLRGRGLHYGSVVALGDPSSVVAAISGAPPSRRSALPDSTEGVVQRFRTRSVACAAVFSDLLAELYDASRASFRWIATAWHSRECAAARIPDALSDSAERVSSLSRLTRIYLRRLLGAVSVDLCARSRELSMSSQWCVVGGGDDNRVSLLRSLLASGSADAWPRLPPQGWRQARGAIWLLDWGGAFRRWATWFRAAWLARPELVSWVAYPGRFPPYLHDLQPYVRATIFLSLADHPVVEPSGARPSVGPGGVTDLCISALASEQAWATYCSRSPPVCSHPPLAYAAWSRVPPSWPHCSCVRVRVSDTRMPPRDEILDALAADGDVQRRPGPPPVLLRAAPSAGVAIPLTPVVARPHVVSRSLWSPASPSSVAIELPCKRLRFLSPSPAPTAPSRRSPSPTSAKVDTGPPPVPTEWPARPCGNCFRTVASAHPARFCDDEACFWLVCRRCSPVSKDARPLLCPAHQLRLPPPPPESGKPARLILLSSTEATVARWIGRLLSLVEGVPPVALAAHPLRSGPLPAFALEAAEARAALWHASRRTAATGPLRRLWQLTLLLRSTDAPLSAIPDLAVTYAARRLDDPLEGWRSAAPTRVAAELSAVAACSRDDDLPLPAYCSSPARALLCCRGAFERPEHTASYPLTTRMLVQAAPQVPPSERVVYDSLLFQSIAGLRAGLPMRVSRDMLRALPGGHILLWTRRTKTRRGDRSAADPTLMPQISALAGPVFDALLARAPRSGLLFPAVTLTRANALLRTLFPHVAPPFVLRAHGIRAGTDSVLQALRVPRDIVDAFGWWKRERRSSGYYASLMLGVMFRAASILHHVEISPVVPGSALLTAVHVPVPDWTSLAAAVSQSSPIVLPEVPTPADLRDDHASSSDDDCRPAILPHFARSAVEPRRSRHRPSRKPAASELPIAFVRSGRCPGDGPRVWPRIRSSRLVAPGVRLPPARVPLVIFPDGFVVPLPVVLARRRQRRPSHSESSSAVDSDTSADARDASEDRRRSRAASSADSSSQWVVSDADMSTPSRRGISSSSASPARRVRRPPTRVSASSAASDSDSDWLPTSSTSSDSPISSPSLPPPAMRQARLRFQRPTRPVPALSRHFAGRASPTRALPRSAGPFRSAPSATGAVDSTPSPRPRFPPATGTPPSPRRPPATPFAFTTGTAAALVPAAVQVLELHSSSDRAASVPRALLGTTSLPHAATRHT